MRISIVEDNQTLLENLKLLLTGEPNYEIVGAFTSAEDAMPAMHNNPPEVLLTDLAFPGMSGIELIGEGEAEISGNRCHGPHSFRQ